ncbi:MAG TPA: 4a-hydroxytetrahydrobiopterin dehydratase [Bacillota bacterium]
MSRLSEDEIAARLAALPGWTREGNAIRRTYRLASFREALFFVNAVAALAESANHHPDIDIRYKQVTLTLTTHDAQGLTARDFDLAAAIDRHTARYAAS